MAQNNDTFKIAFLMKANGERGARVVVLYHLSLARQLSSGRCSSSPRLLVIHVHVIVAGPCGIFAV